MVDQPKEMHSYRQVLDAGLAPATTEPLVAAPIRIGADTPLGLRDAIVLANRRNESLASAGEGYLQALINVNRSAEAFLPTVSLGASYSVSHATPGPGVHGATHSFGVSGSVNETVFNGMANVATLRQSKAAAEQSKQLLLDQQATLLLNVAQTYYAVLSAEAQSRVLENSLSLQGEKVREMQLKLEVGSAKPLDLAQSQSDLSNTRVSLLQSRNTARDGRYTLANLIGVTAIDGPLIDDFLPPPDTAMAPLPSFLDEASRSRQDVIAAASAVAAAQQGVAIAVAQYYPQIALGYQQPIYSDPVSGLLWSAALSASQSIFSAGVLEAGVRDALSVLRQAMLAQSQVTRQAADDVRTSYDNVTTSAAKLAELNALVISAQQAYDLAEQSYQLGHASNLDRLTAQDDLLNAQLQLTTERFNHKVFYLDLLRATGHFGLAETAATIARLQAPATRATTEQSPASAPTTQPATPGG